MRQPLLTGTAAVYDQVDKLIKRFEYPDEAGGGFGGGGGAQGGAFTIQIAASDALDVEKAKADPGFVCSGTNDHDVIQAAADLIHGATASWGGRILLSSGTFNVSAGSLSLGIGIHIQGVALEYTVIRSTDTSGVVLTMGAGSIVSDLTLRGPGAGGTTEALVVGSGSVVARILLLEIDQGITPGDDTVIMACRCDTVDTFIDATDVYNDLVIANNMTTSHITLGASNRVLIVGNRIEHEILADGGAGIAIVGNISDNSDVVTDSLIDLNNLSDFLVADNSLGDLDGWHGITLDTCDDGVVSGNQFNLPDAGIRVFTCSNVSVLNNGVTFAGLHGIHVDDSDDCLIANNRIYQPSQNTDDTYDGIFVEGDSDRNDLWGNKIIGASSAPQPRYGINISAATCDDNSYLGNRTGPATDYGTGAYVDSGTGTINVWPGAAAPQGDNLL